MAEEEGHVDELVAPYVLGALEPEEVEAVELHLLWCDECRTLVEEERQVAALLPYLAEPQPVPLRARRRLFSRVVEQPIPIESRRRLPTALVRTGWVAAIAAAVLAMVFAFNGQQMQAQVEKKDSELEVLKENQRVVAQVLNSPRGFVTTLHSTGVAPGAEGGVILDPTRNAALLVVDGLPKLPSGHAYVVWMVRGSQHINVGVLPVDDQGRGQLLITPPDTLLNYSSILITEESGALTANPTGIRMMAAEMGD